jgi:two-component system nitrogen regulation response regulator GlnG
LGVETKKLSDAAMAQVTTFEFPGNVRQLENLCHWLTVMAPAQTVDPKDLPPEVQGSALSHAAHAAQVANLANAAAPSMSAPGPSAPGQAAGLPTGSDAARSAPAGQTAGASWLADLEHEARSLLENGQPEVWDHLTRLFEGRLITTALAITKGRRIEAAHKLGIGRNTITRKIQELGLD